MANKCFLKSLETESLLLSEITHLVDGNDVIMLKYFFICIFDNLYS